MFLVFFEKKLTCSKQAKKNVFLKTFFVSINQVQNSGLWTTKNLQQFLVLFASSIVWLYLVLFTGFSGRKSGVILTYHGILRARRKKKEEDIQIQITLKKY